MGLCYAPFKFFDSSVLTEIRSFFRKSRQNLPLGGRRVTQIYSPSLGKK
jgi:hypothetical protein